MKLTGCMTIKEPLNEEAILIDDDSLLVFGTLSNRTFYRHYLLNRSVNSF